jgi:hypothetical protein
VKKKPILGVICLVIISAVIIFGDQVNPDNLKDNEIDGSNVFHIRLADPTLYEKGIYVDYFQVEKGVYEFRFVPNGDSPQKLSIKLFTESDVVLMDNHFELEGSLVEDDISSWYTWDYLGEKRISFDELQQIKIIVSPNGDLRGPVSIELIPMK